MQRNRALRTPAPLILVGLLAFALLPGASAQSVVSVGKSLPASPVSPAPAGSGGSYLGGTDDCNGVHPLLPPGCSTGNLFNLSSSSTGTTGQNEANCYIFGTTGIDHDVWLDWTSTTDGNVTLTTCGGTTVDTKVAVYPDQNCPADGTSIACNDDQCGTQSSLTWPVTSGATYTIQLGTFPGSPGGLGTLDLSSCTTLGGAGAYEITGNSTGADFCIRVTHCGVTKTAPVAGLPAGAQPEEFATRIADQIDAMNPFGTCAVTAIDLTLGAFVLGWSSGSLTFEIGDGSCTSFCTVTTGTPCSFNPVITQVGESPLEPGQSLCFCEPASAPCGNPAPIGAGCANSAGTGSTLSASGSDSVSGADAGLHVADAIPGMPGLFFQGETFIQGGGGVSFGDGRRCCGGGVIRLQIVVPDASGDAGSSVDLVAQGGVFPGDTRCYQFWYRDPAGPCASTFNLTNAYAISWAP